MAKDSRLALEMAVHAGFEAPLGQAAARCFREACESGFGALDDGSLLEMLRKAGA